MLRERERPVHSLADVDSGFRREAKEGTMGRREREGDPPPSWLSGILAKLACRPEAQFKQRKQPFKLGGFKKALGWGVL